MKEYEWYWQDELFGKTPESGSWEDIGQSLLNPNYDPEGRLLGRVLRENPNQGLGGAGVNKEGDPMYGSTDEPDEEPKPEEEEIIEPFQSSDYQMDLPPRIEMQYDGPQKTINPDRVGGPPVENYGTQRQRMVLDDGSEEEERRRRIAAILRRSQRYG